MINGSLSTLIKRYRNQEDVYHTNKETWKQIEEKIAGKIWNSILSDS
ncbi:26653_t:CDS:2 [Gigaspora margarita]|uniref:26653_t:CDS:1 n=1 Tax=Gigaspora margarita TaxID=4874 RepID=A0ABN7UZJ1_GIGMA|nr:26653_t:CDS:2 [Gigaspora margarita]